jgi:hypothetical protein
MNQRRQLFLIVMMCASGALHASPQLFSFVLPWNDSSNSAISLGGLNAAPAGTQGFVGVDANGHLATTAGRMRFWGVNTCFGADFPQNADADAVAARMAKFGINIVRFHHMDMYAAQNGIWSGTSPDRTLSPAQLDKLDYFINALKRHGIYADLNLCVSRPFNRGSDLPAAIDSVSDWKIRAALGFFDSQILSLQKQYAQALLTHVNPYTGNAYINEPAVAFIEINNENGLLQQYLSGQIDAIPGYYKNELTTQWNAWLLARYTTNAALVSAWNILSAPTGSEMITNGNSSNAAAASWNLEQHNGAAASISVTNDAPGGGRALRIDVTATGSEGWYVQCNQGSLALDKSKPYILSFLVKADMARAITATIGMAHDPWSDLGYSMTANCTTAWQQFCDTFNVTASDANGRLNFSNMATHTGTIWLSDISLKIGGTVGLYAGENLDNKTIPYFPYQNGPARTTEARHDWYGFLTVTEKNYWVAMRDYIKTTLGARSIVFGTIMGCSTPNILSAFDVFDTHAYWQHPDFPGVAWSSTDWRMNNSAMVNHQTDNTFLSLAPKRVLGRPHCVTEYNHPAPNTFQAECFLFLATYASLQDWDAVFAFDYNSSLNSWNRQMATGYFDIDQNPVKMASLIPAANAFRRADIAPALQQVVAPISKETELEQLFTTWAWKLVDATSAGVNAAVALQHRIAIALDGQSVPADALPVTTAAPTGGAITSDTREIVWDASTAGKGFITVDTRKTKFVYGYCGGRTVTLSGFTIAPADSGQNGFSVLALSVMKGDSFGNASQILLTALGTQQNTGQLWYQYPSTALSFPPAEDVSITSRDQWGSAPSLCEGISGTVTLPYAPSAVQVWALTATGARGTALPVSASSGSAQFTIAPASQALWYELAVTGPPISVQNNGIHQGIASSVTIAVTGKGLHLRIPSAQPTMVRFFTATGVLARQKCIEGKASTCTIPFNGLRAGCYMISVSTAAKTQVIRHIIY